MATERAAGMGAVGVLWGLREAGELSRAGAEALVAHLGEILDIIFPGAVTG